MIDDVYGGRHSSRNVQAVAAFEKAVVAFAAHRAFLPHLEAALRLDGGLVAAHAFAGIAHTLVGRAHAMIASRALVAATGAALAAAGGGTAHEQALADAHADAADGRLRDAAGRLEAHLEGNPTSLLALKLAHALRFMSGDAARMLETSSSVLPYWAEETPGFGYVLGCRAFALEECGRRREAEQIGHRALRHEPSDVWALHAVAHVLEMDHRTREGRMLLEPVRRVWSENGGFGQHLTWHLALFHLDEGDRERALALYDEAITPSEGGCFRDMANAVSLLWRLEQEGVDVGNRWNLVRTIAHHRRRETTYAFGSLHYLLALLAKSDVRAAAELIAEMRLVARAGSGDQAAVMTEVALPLADALFRAADRGKPAPVLAAASRLQALGGSHAQRDIFLRTLMCEAADARDHAVLSSLSMLRRQQRSDDRFTEIVRRRTSRRARSAETMIRENV